MNINKKIREYINNADESFKEQMGGCSLVDFDATIKMSQMNPFLCNEGKKQANILDGLINATGYSDMYTSLILKQKTHYLTDAESICLDMLKKINSYDELQEMYQENSQMFFIAIKEMIGFYKSYAYHKILRMKCLSDEDIAQISKINTVFNQDLDEYNIDVTLDYIIKRILKFKDLGIDDEELLSDASEFITNMKLANEKCGKRLALRLIENSIKLLGLLPEELCNKCQEIMLDSYKYGIEFLLDSLSFNSVKSLLNISIRYNSNKEKIDEIPLDDESKKLLNKIRKYELEMDENV